MFKKLRNRRAFKVAKGKAEKAGGMVCATVTPDGAPKYFVMPRDAADDAIERTAFTLRYGRAPSPGEDMVSQLIKQRAASKDAG